MLPRRRFDVVLAVLHMHYTVFEWIWETISSNMFNNAVTKDFHFLYLLWSIIFHAVALCRLLPVSSTIACLCFDSDLIQENYHNFDNCPCISFKILIAVFNWVFNFYDWFKKIIYFMADPINILYISACSFKAVTSAELLCDHICFASVVKSSGVVVCITGYLFRNISVKIFEGVNWKWRRFLFWVNIYVRNIGL